MEFGQSVKNGARAAATAAGLQIVYDQGFPPSMTDLTTVVRQIQATNPDIVAIGTQPGQSIAIVRAINEVGLKAKIVGGGMTGLQTTDAEGFLGEQLNGFVNFNIWLPAPKMQYPGVMDFIKRYQERAKGAGVDPIGYYAAPWAYAELQILGQAVEATKSTAGDKLGPYIHATTFKTIVGDVKFGRERRMGAAAHAGGAIPACERQRHRAVQGHGQSRRHLARRIQERRAAVIR